MNNITTIDIELGIMKEFNFRQNIIIPNITNLMKLLPFETDMLIISKSGFATGFEIKISLSDLKADFKKPQHKGNFEDFYYKFKYFNYAVPDYLLNEALKLIPEFCGLYILKRINGIDYLRCVKQPKLLFNYKFSDSEINYILRLGTMRIYYLKKNIQKLKKN